MNRQYPSKIKNKDELRALVNESRIAGRKIVLCHGCFDIIHPGHIRHLREARHFGDLLVVSITGDAAIDKGSDRPYIAEELRAENLAALELVDFVYIDPHESATEILQTVQPDVYVKGEEYASSQDPRFVLEQQTAEACGGRVVFTSGDIVFSSSELIRRAGRDAEIEGQRLNYVCQRHEITLRSLTQMMDHFCSQRIVVVGDMLVDRYAFCDTIDAANEAPMLSLKFLEQRDFIGGAGAVARHLAGLGAQVCLVTCLGRDEASRKMSETLQAEGIETHSLFNRERLAIKTRFLVEETKLLRVETAEHRPLDSSGTKKAQRILIDRAAHCDAVMFCDFGYGVITEGLLGGVLRPLRAAVPIMTAKVSGTRGSLLDFRHVDLFCPSERELRTTLHSFDQGLSVVASKLMEATQARHLIATLGRRGLVVFDRQSQDPTSSDWGGRLRSEYFQPLSGRTLDAMGCSDALLAGSTLSLASGSSLIQAAYVGSAMAAIEGNEIGNIPIEASGLRRWLKTRPELVCIAKTHTQSSSQASARQAVIGSET